MKHPILTVCLCFAFISSGFAQMPCISFSSALTFPSNGRFTATFTFNATPPMSPAFLSGHPYSGEEISQTQRILADGTTSTLSQPSNFIYRDLSGRTRNERAMSPSINGKSLNLPMTPQIFDPVAGYCYCLDTVKRIAHRVALPKEIKTINPGERLVFPMMKSFTPGEKFNPKDLSFAKEDLGTKTIEGISVRGSRRIMTYPAGSVGNDKPLQQTTEIWMSPELNATILSKTSDPLSGAMIYTLANVKMTEPDPKLFQIPSDYMVVDEGGSFTIFYTENDKIKAND